MTTDGPDKRAPSGDVAESAGPRCEHEEPNGKVCNLVLEETDGVLSCNVHGVDVAPPDPA